MNTRVLLVPCLLFSTFAMAGDLPSGLLPESGNSDVGYRTVADVGRRRNLTPLAT